MYPFTFPIKEYGDESQQGVSDTDAHSHTDTHTHAVHRGAQTNACTQTFTNVFVLLCCHKQDILNYHRFRLEAVSVFVAATVHK